MQAGSNSFAVGGNLGVDGGALLANDMHLNLNLPHIWYRAVMRWTDAAGAAHRLVGVTLPGVPAQVVGSNGAVAWGYTNSYIDTTDVIALEVESIAQTYYRTPHGFVEIEHRPEIIQVKGAAPVTWTRAGPNGGQSSPDRRTTVSKRCAGTPMTRKPPISPPSISNSRPPRLTRRSDIAHRMGIPNQNLVVADRAGQHRVDRGRAHSQARRLRWTLSRRRGPTATAAGKAG